MSDPYVGEIRMFGGNYAPQQWHFCDGTLLPISAYQPLYALIGTTYGGDGVNTFALPDLRGRLPLGQGQGPNLSPRPLGQYSGSETVSLSAAQLPAHSHTVNASKDPATQTSPQNGVWGVMAGGNQFIAPGEVVAPAVIRDMSPAAIGTGYPSGGTAHDNMMPSFPLSFIIALQGEYPQPT